MTISHRPMAFRTLTLTAACLSTMTLLAGAAIAERRTPAPINYASPSQNQPASTDRQTVQEPQQQARNAPGRRVEFRYPDQPDMFYGAGGARSTPDAPPMNFSSSSAAIAPAAARQYAMAEPTRRTVAPTTSRDPAITAGGFDARAAAARAASEKQLRAQEEPSEVAAPYMTAAGQVDFTSAASTSSPAVTEQPVSGDVFNPAANPGYDREGQAGTIAAELNGQPTANGEIYDQTALTAAHPTLPLPSLVHVVNTTTGRETVVRVNDRGPFSGNGLIEVSERAAELLQFDPNGRANVRVRYLGPAPAAPQMAETAPRPRSQAPVPAQEELAGGTREPLFAVPQPVVRQPVRYAPPSQAGSYFVQLGSFADISNAERLHGLARTRTDVRIVPVNVRGTDFFRVMAGPLRSRADADTLRDRLENQGVADGLVVSTP